MTVELARRLLSSGAVQARDVEAALYLSVVRGVSVARALVDGGAVSERALEEELARRGGLAVRQVAGSGKIAARLPRGLCRMLAAVPTRVDPSTGVVEVAAIDAHDAHVASELSFHLGQPVRLVRATIAAVEEAIRRVELDEDAGRGARQRRKTPAFPHGAPDSVPPPPPVPPPEEVPIPLVRRASIAPPPDSDDAPIPLTGGRASDPGSRRAPEEPRAPRRATPRGGTPAAGATTPRVPNEQAPTVSFPSSPPPALPDDAGLRAATRAALAPARAPSIPAEPPPAAVVLPPGLAAAAELTPLPEEHGPALPVPGATGARFASLAEILAAIGRAPDRDAVLELALTAMLRVAERAAVFVVRRDAFQGWICNPAFGAESLLREVLVPQRVPSALATAVAAGYYLGPLPGTAAHAGIVEVMGRSSGEVAVVVARVAGRPALLLVADQLDDTLLGTRALGEIAERVGGALERVVLRRG